MIALRALVLVAALAGALPAFAHSASDAYLTLGEAQVVAGATVVEGRIDIALRDLHFVLGLDDDGDGKITWGEARRHEAQIARYAYDGLRVDADGSACRIEPLPMKIADRADGAYVALNFRISCGGAAAKLTLDYRLFFAVDPSHRGIAVFRTRGGAATALFAPDNTRVTLGL